jgi:hypothetical protein
MTRSQAYFITSVNYIQNKLAEDIKFNLDMNDIDALRERLIRTQEALALSLDELRNEKTY